jgi:Amino acid transporters
MTQCIELITGILANTPSIQMMALADTIGTGLFLGSGRALANAGPAGIFMGCTIMGLLISVTLSIGELNATFLQQMCHSTRCLLRGSRIFLCTRMVCHLSVPHFHSGGDIRSFGDHTVLGETFISSYLDIVIYAGLYFGYKLRFRTNIVSLDESPVVRFVQTAEK